MSRSWVVRGASRVASAFTTPLAPEDYWRLVDPRASRRQLRGIVTAVTPETSSSATISFRPGRGWDPHLAGQWARIGVEIDGVRHWRSYSLSTPAGADPAITVTAMGRVSSALVTRVRPGDVLFLAPPQGDFVLPDHPRPLLMLTAGSGLTPVMSMVRTLVPRRPDADVVLVHSSRTPEDTLFREELLELADQFPGLRVVFWFTGERGRRLQFQSLDDLAALVPDWRDRAAYACGPTGFLDDAQALWQREEAELRIERFSAVRRTGGGDSESGGGRVIFARSDREADIGADESLLEAGERCGVVLPSGCRMGICRSCLVPLASGRLRDLRTGAVHGEEGELVQTCIATAVGDVHLDA